MISVYGSDQPGIVYHVAQALADRKVNVTDLNTKLIGSEDRPVYVMMIEAVLPPGLEIEELETVLSSIRTEMQVDISIRAIETVEL